MYTLRKDIGAVKGALILLLHVLRWHLRKVQQLVGNVRRMGELICKRTKKKKKTGKRLGNSSLKVFQ